MSTTTAVQTTEELNDPEQLLLIAWCGDCRWQAPYDGHETLCSRCHGKAELLTASELHAREQRALAGLVADQLRGSVLAEQPSAKRSQRRTSEKKELLTMREAA